MYGRGLFLKLKNSQIDGECMKAITYDVPSLFGDHHVTEVRNLLLAIPGVNEVYASSSFQIVEVSYDPEIVNDLQIAMKLDEKGYLGEWSLPSEVGAVIDNESGSEVFTRHTAVYEHTRQVVSFSQKVETAGRPLWNCPGMGVMSTEKLLKKMEE
jgi:copper chaperone CopZ